MFSLFFLAGLIAYVGYIKKGRRAILYAAALVLFGLALFSKVTAISFPLVLLLLERHFEGRIDRPAVLRTAPFWLLSVMFFVLAFVLHDAMFTGSLRRVPSYVQSLSAFFYAFPFYAGKILAPLRLHPGYSNSIGHDPWQAVLGFLALATLASLAYLAYRRKPDLVTFGVGFAILTLLPTLPFHFFGQPYEDRYMYLPLAGILLALAGLIPAAAMRIRPFGRAAAVLWPALVLVGGGLGAISSRQGLVWHDSISLWSYAAKEDPRNAVGLVKRGEALEEVGRLAEALDSYRQAELYAPESPRVPQHIGAVLFKQGELQKALDEYNRSLALDPLFYDGYLSRGVLWGRLGEYEKAVLDFTAALKLNRTSKGFYYRAMAFLETRKTDAALEDLRSAYRIDPSKALRDLMMKLEAGALPGK